MRLLYDLFLFLYTLGIRIYALFNDKAKKWLEGRKDWELNLVTNLQPGEKRMWIHCSSVGEFEQARPVIEGLKQQYHGYKTVVTFFSPSGYEAIRKNAAVDYIFYLPMDGAVNAEKFVSLLQPSLAIFIKYEFWYYYLRQLKRSSIPVLLVSGTFREGQAFFKWYGGLFRKMLSCFDLFFLQDDESKVLLGDIGFTGNVVVSGDTRYDRVAAIANNVTAIPAAERFRDGYKILIAGSTWPGDESILKECLPVLPDGWKLIIAPHEVDIAHVTQVKELFGNDAILFSELNDQNTGAEKKALIINNIGMLSRLFAYGDVAFIGGGFQKGGIHNVLEPAVFGLPVVFGPVYEKFVEAKELAEKQLVFPVSDAAECRIILLKLINDDHYRTDISAVLKIFMHTHTGATSKVLAEIKNRKLLR